MALFRGIFKEAFTQAGLQYFNPHSFRHTLVSYGQKLCRTPEEFKAWSQNLGHEGVLTTFYSYGDVQPQRQAEIIQKLKFPDQNDESETNKMLKTLLQKMDDQQAGRSL